MLALTVALAAVPACFNPPSDSVDTGFETITPPTTSATTDPDASAGSAETAPGTAGMTSTSNGDTTVVVDGTASESGPATTDAPAECGDGMVGGDEACDDAGESATCNVDCTAAGCGDGLLNVTAGEGCDDEGESATCDADCTPVECGDATANATAGEACDDAGESAACNADCTPAACGDTIVNATAGEECDDGNDLPGDGCQECLASAAACSGGANMLGANPAGTMMVCDDPTDTVCEQDAESLCPAGWGLCTLEQHQARNAGFDYPLGGAIVVGEIYCRGGGAGAGAGHYTLGPYDGVVNLDQDPPLNCGFGSSRPACTSMYGCNETTVSALCCAPSPTCGNGIVDAPEELCDDDNANEDDECLNSCGWRVPSAHGFPAC